MLSQVIELALYRICDVTEPVAVLVIYEYLITLRDEAYMVSTRWRTGTWVFVLNRYILLFLAVAALIPLTDSVRPWFHQNCIQGSFTVNTEVR